MDADFRRNLKGKILEHSPEFGLERILHSSFVRQVTENLQVSAMDAAYAISSLLEFPHHINTFNDEESVKRGQN